MKCQQLTVHLGQRSSLTAWIWSPQVFCLAHTMSNMFWNYFPPNFKLGKFHIKSYIYSFSTTTDLLTLEQNYHTVILDFWKAVKYLCANEKMSFPQNSPQKVSTSVIWMARPLKQCPCTLYNLHKHSLMETAGLLGEFLETCIWSSLIQRMDSWLNPWVMSGQWFTHLSSSQFLSPNSSDKASYLSSKEDKRPNSPSEHNTSPLSSNSDVSLCTSWTPDPAPALPKGAD